MILRGADASANLYSLVITAKTNGIDPYYYWKRVFAKLPKASSFADLSYKGSWVFDLTMVIGFDSRGSLFIEQVFNRLGYVDRDYSMRDKPSWSPKAAGQYWVNNNDDSIIVVGFRGLAAASLSSIACQLIGRGA